MLVINKVKIYIYILIIYLFILEEGSKFTYYAVKIKCQFVTLF